MITVDNIYQTKPRFYRQLYAKGLSGMRNRYEVFQDEFLSELDPSGHKINDRSIYENIMKKVPKKDVYGNEMMDDNGNAIFELTEIPIERVSIPIQDVIRTKQVSNITAEQTRFAHLKLKPTEEESNVFVDFKNGWNTKNMETAKYEFIDSVKTTGDGAFCGIIYKGEFSYKVFSKLNKDTLHPIFDSLGDLKLFGRGYTVYDYEKQEDIPCLDVWDDKYLYTYRYNIDTNGNGTKLIWDDKDGFITKRITDTTEDGWELQSQKEHGFKKIPIVYLKDEKGACWSYVQDLIDKLEMALSQLAENNKSYAFRIMIVKGGFSVEGDLKGQARAIMLDDEKADAKFLDKADASDTFELQLRTLLQHILLGSFVVVPPEINGDISGVAVKILYSPSFEQGIRDINFFNKSIDDMIRIFKEGYGVEKANISGFKSLEVRGDMMPYIPQNENEKQQNLALGVQNGYLSKESASEQNTTYSSPSEMTRIKEQDSYDSELQANRERATLVGTE